MKKRQETWEYQANSIIKQRNSFGLICKNKDRFYYLWIGIRQRCTNKNNPNYKWYGKRGIGSLITIEDIIRLWCRDKAHLMKNPSIDREDNNGHYTFSNCRFIELIDNVKKSHQERKFREFPVKNKLLSN